MRPTVADISISVPAEWAPQKAIWTAWPASAAEWNDDLGHIEGARQIPVTDLPNRIGELSAWTQKPVVVVCRVGVRSALAAR